MWPIIPLGSGTIAGLKGSDTKSIPMYTNAQPGISLGPGIQRDAGDSVSKYFFLVLRRKRIKVCIFFKTKDYKVLKLSI